jgi:hypothetical protein
MPQLIFYAEVDDHGIRQGDSEQIIAQWRRLVAYKAALDMLRWAMRLSPHRRIVMVVNMAHDGGTFVNCSPLFRLTNRSKIT